MRKIIFFILLIATAGVAYAQATSLPGVLGSLSTSGCPGAFKPCFTQYSVTNPMPVVVSR